MNQDAIRQLKLTDQQRIELYTLMSQWNRKFDLQVEKVGEWTESRIREAVSLTRAQVIEECARVAVVNFCTRDQVSAIRALEGKQ